MLPFPVTPDGDQGKRLDLANESRTIEHGFLGRSTRMTDSGHSPFDCHDGQPDSSAAQIFPHGDGLTPTTSASGSLAPTYGASIGVGEGWRQASHNSDLLPPDAAPPDRHTGGSDSVSLHLLQDMGLKSD